MTAPHTLNSHPTTIAFTKGHGTQNDFIILPDPEAQLSLTPQLIATLCDRQRGIGADGILRVATTGALRRAGLLTNNPTSLEAMSDNDWFMDYYNADGSVAAMAPASSPTMFDPGGWSPPTNSPSVPAPGRNRSPYIHSMTITPWCLLPWGRPHH